MLHSLLALLQAADPAATAWGNLIAGVGAVGTSFLLAQVKKTDYAVAQSKLFKKLQPVLTLGVALGAPWVAAHASSHVDVSQFGVAPFATLATVVGAELLAMFKRST